MLAPVLVIGVTELEYLVQHDDVKFGIRAERASRYSQDGKNCCLDEGVGEDSTSATSVPRVSSIVLRSTSRTIAYSVPFQNSDRAPDIKSGNLFCHLVTHGHIILMHEFVAFHCFCQKLNFYDDKFGTNSRR